MVIKSSLLFSRHLRTNNTDAERRLWYRLRDRRLKGYKFRRQHPIGKYIVDFCCIERSLVLELDGGQHATHLINADRERTAYFWKMGFQVLRFWDNDVLRNEEGILLEIVNTLERLPSASYASSPGPTLPSPLRGEGKDEKVSGPHSVEGDEKVSGPHSVEGDEEVSGPHSVEGDEEVSGPHSVEEDEKVNVPHSVEGGD